MQKISNPLFVEVITKLFILLVIAKIISLSIWWFLPTEGVEYQQRENYKPSYQRVDFKVMLDAAPVKSGIHKQNTNAQTTQEGINITNMILKGLYGNGDHGMAIIALKSSPQKTSVVAVGEEYSGYILKRILQESVAFVKDAKEFVLKMPKQKQVNKSFISEMEEETYKQVNRADINDYVEQRKDIWKDIALEPVQDGPKLKGFKVKRINHSSKIGALGLKVGDTIIAANNTPLTSVKDVMELYKNLKSLNTLQLVVLRNSQEVELIFDIN